MGFLAVVSLIAGSILIGLGYQLVGRSGERIDWAVGMVGSLYGGLLASASLGPGAGSATVLDGLYAGPALVGGVAGGGLLVLAYRGFGRRSARPLPPVAEIVSSRQVVLAYSPVLLCEPIISQLRRRFGVSTRIGAVDVSHGRGSVELEVMGSSAAVDAAIGSLRQSGFDVPFGVDAFAA